MNWPWQKKQTAPVRPLAPHRMGFDLEYWRGRQDLIEETRKIYATRWFQEWISVLHHELPLDSIEAVRGHKRLLRIMELMSESPAEQVAELVPTFGAEKEFPELAEQS